MRLFFSKSSTKEDRKGTGSSTHECEGEGQQAEMIAACAMAEESWKAERGRWSSSVEFHVHLTIPRQLVRVNKGSGPNFIRVDFFSFFFHLPGREEERRRAEEERVREESGGAAFNLLLWLPSCPRRASFASLLPHRHLLPTHLLYTLFVTSWCRVHQVCQCRSLEAYLSASLMQPCDPWILRWFPWSLLTCNRHFNINVPPTRLNNL